MSNQQPLHKDEAPPSNNLVHLEQEIRADGQAKDTNARIGLRESNLSENYTLNLMLSTKALMKVLSD